MQKMKRDLAECAETYPRAAALAKGGDQDHILSGLGTVSIERYRRKRRRRAPAGRP